VHSIGEHDEQVILNLELVLFIWNVRFQLNSCQLQISFGKRSYFHTGIKVTHTHTHTPFFPPILSGKCIIFIPPPTRVSDTFNAFPQLSSPPPPNFPFRNNE
jgi:hypothetical protein